MRSNLVCALLLLARCAWSAGRDTGLSPGEALEAFEPEPGFAVSLVAAEPLTVDPVAIAFDEHGQLFVAEDRDYPLGAADGRPLGMVALLRDADGDGRMDTRSDFATGIRFPNGVMPWRSGVIVTASPDVLWYADTDGDGRADIREVLLTGFDTNSTSQLRANDPTPGPDGWVYLAGGLRGGRVYSPRNPGVIVVTDKGDLRFKPDTGEMELVPGKSQFGLAFDDAGERFACMNRIQCQHAPLASRYIARNPLMPSPGVLQDCPEFPANNLMTRYTAGAARYYPISDNRTTADSHAGTYSAACAVHIHRGSLLPKEYHGAVFSCDPTGNLVRGDRLEKRGGSFIAHRIHDGTEALRSSDNWFRPVFLADGPDGALYIADMYRKTIEHPEYLPGEVRKHTDFDSGRNAGRIWRLGSIGEQPAGRPEGKPMSLRRDGETLASCVAELDSPVPWRRDTAFRLLLEKRDTNVTGLVRNAFRETDSAGPAVAKLRLLACFDAIDEDLLLRALRHSEAGVRRNAVQLSEPFLERNAHFRSRIVELGNDDDSHVRFQVALSLGGLRNPDVVRTLARIVFQQCGDRWTRAAVLSGVTSVKEAEALFLELTRVTGSIPPGLLNLVRELSREYCVWRSREAELKGFYADLTRIIRAAPPGLRLAAHLGFASVAGAEFQRQQFAEEASFKEILKQAHSWSATPDTAEELRLFAIEALAFDDSTSTLSLLRSFLGPEHPREIQRAAAQSLLQPARLDGLQGILTSEVWSRYTPGVRMMILDRLTSSSALSRVLLDALESEEVPVGALTPGQRELLRRSRDEQIQARAVKLLSASGGDRDRAFEQAKAALDKTPVPGNGRNVFEKHCSMCHRLNQQGVAVGPDLFDIRNQSKESILYHIIIPEAEIAPNFISYECELKDGRLVSGLLPAETGTTITVRMAQGAEEVIQRADIAKLNASRLSLMPQEFEKTVSIQDLADLLAYLRGEE